MKRTIQFRSWAVAGAMVLAVSACDQGGGEYTKLASGAQFVKLQEGGSTNKVDQTTSHLTIDFQALFWGDSSFIKGQYTIPMVDSMRGDDKAPNWYQVFNNCAENDSVKIKTDLETLYKYSLLADVPAYMRKLKDEEVIVGVKLMHVLDEEGYQNLKYEQETENLLAAVMARALEIEDGVKNAKERAAQRQADGTAKTKEDIATIKAYLAKQGITDAVQTESGLFYRITEEGRGLPMESGSFAKINYAGYTLDGTLFDTSIEEVAKANNAYNPNRPYEPLKTWIGMGEVIDGWDEGLTYFSEGAKGTLYIPNIMAYGDRSRAGGLIKPGDILVFDVEVVRYAGLRDMRSEGDAANGDAETE